MTPEIWARIEDLFSAALELPPRRRAAFLRAACPDERVRSEVEQLIGASDAGLPALESGISVQAPRADAEPARGALAAGTLLGAWRVVEPIGSGGMGEVYLAQRADGAFDQRVAVKVLRAEASAHLARFESERQILARLEHPGIARLLDAGVAPDGRPFMVMEFVDGEALGRYWRRCALPLRDRLRLFLEVCAAVSFAHAHLVVHRDLKSGNVLVTAEGRAKLLDFGVAKLLDPARWPGGDQVTHAAPLTPESAAPEQMLGKPITTATDVYALGVALYELVSGRSPWAAVRHLPVSVALNHMLHQDPPLPSSAVPALRGDLDAIVMRALRKDPAARYASAEALAADVRAWLDGRPVAARDGGTAYVLGKFVRRHRAAMAAASLVAALLAAFTWRLADERGRALAAEGRAATEAAAAVQVTDYLVSMFRSVAPAQGGGKPVEPRQLVDLGRAQLDQRLREAPLLRGRLRATLGQLYTELGLGADAIAMLADALAIQRSAAEADPLLTAQYLLALGDAQHQQLQYADAERALGEALRLREQRLAPDDPRVAQAALALGRTRVELGRVDDGIALLERARTILHARGADQGAAQGRVLHALGLAQHRAGRWQEARRLLQQSVALLQGELGADHIDTLAAQSDYGAVLGEQDDNLLAEQVLRDVLERAIRVYGPESLAVAADQSLLASALSAQGRLREAIDLQRSMLATERRIGDRTLLLANDLANLASDLQTLGDAPEALPLIEEALAVVRDAGGAQTIDGFYVQTIHGRILQGLGRPRESIDALQGELPAQLRGNLADGYRGQRLLTLGDGLRLLGRLDDAGQAYARAEAILTASQEHGQQIFAALHRSRGLLLWAQGRGAPALEQLRGALREWQAAAPGDPRTLSVALELAELQLETGDLQAARATLQPVESPAAAAFRDGTQDARRLARLRLALR